MTDRFAQCVLQDDTMDPGTEYTLSYVKSSIKDFAWSFVAIEAVALVFTMHVSPRAVLTPMGDTDRVAMKLKLG
ncbi:hypothetical protein E2C01_016213 [Portunus trituberculatus]|uniref:Uncharacterized protein n=1 Tax=Portunus trituberculatus TaxID=210409 RepID=A0A5B7DQ59_PORTR|nr:hypothetical protein [Portunus trituberculatus]